jgi:hypothetical protein
MIERDIPTMDEPTIRTTIKHNHGGDITRYLFIELILHVSKGYRIDISSSTETVVVFIQATIAGYLHAEIGDRLPLPIVVGTQRHMDKSNPAPAFSPDY